ncbi:MAG: 1-deoxy-D-xylulose-5-phosphate reductoisomerase [Magnetococcales bacterium]|nr:1-deoxy-D-xylulose-5-phosphate reductoisomerase [Magnetococcales bacterium]
MQSLALLGATGSIGENVLEIVAAHPERFRVVAMAAGGERWQRLAELARRFRPEAVAVWEPDAAAPLRDALADLPIQVFSGGEGVCRVAAWESARMTVAAIVGSAGLSPTLAAVRAGKAIALANKECLVVGGGLFMEEVRRHGVSLLPVDSEHSAIFQVFQHKRHVRRLILTASGGPFRGWRRERLATVKPDQALSHPNWRMGRKITIDSATLMNKGLEVIEAHWLFDIPPAAIDVVVHPESIVHSLVEYVDGSVLAQLGAPDMRTPIAVALAWPERVNTSAPSLDLSALGRLTFEEPDRESFPCLDLAWRALRQGGGATAALNSANEAAVSAFLQGRIGFLEIPALIADALDALGDASAPTFDALFELDRQTRRWAESWIRRHSSREA